MRPNVKRILGTKAWKDLMYSKVFDTDRGRHVWKEETICELCRKLYDVLVIEANEELLDKTVPVLEKIYLCAIKMTKKLIENKCSLPEWEKHESPEEVKRLRELRIKLTEQLDEVGNNL